MIRLLQWTALAGLFGLLILLTLWIGWLAPSPTYPKSLLLALLVVPLLLPLRGLLHGRSYTHAWASLLSLLYFTLGVMEAYANPAVRGLALLEVLFSLMLFVGGVWYVKAVARAQRAAGSDKRA